MHDFQHTLCISSHFCTGWQFFLFLLYPLQYWYDWRRQRFSQFPNANTNSDGYGYCNRHGNGYCNCHSNGYGNWKSNGHADSNTWWENEANTPGPTDASSSPVGRVAALLCEARTWAPENG